MAVYAVSDLHGCKNFYEQIKKYIKPEDTVYFLGDAGEGGMHSWETIKAIASDPQFIYMKGNHEDMLMRAMMEYQKGYCGSDFALLSRNGGASTYESWIADGAVEGWISWIRKLPTHMEYTRPDGKIVLLSHAGYTPDACMNIPEDRDLIWDRYHFYEGWYYEHEDVYVVHGHTPIPLMDEDVYDGGDNTLAGAFKYCEGHKYCIDSGAVFTGVCTLFNLDTFESIIFEAGIDEIGVE